MFSRFVSRMRAFRRDRRGNIALVTAFALPVMVGSLGLGAEVTSWYNGQRNLQGAADSAAIAAASNGSGSYIAEAKAVAAAYGLQDGANGVTVTPVSGVTCPNGQGARCYRVTVTKLQPLLLAQVVGFRGDSEVGGQPAKRLQASALAIQANAPRDYCILALASSGATNGILGNGVPKADMTGCAIMSNTNSDCNGHTLKADFSDAHLNSAGCGTRNTSNVPTMADPFASLRTNIPTNSCAVANYSWIPVKKKDAALAAANKFHGNESRTLIKVCGDMLLDGDYTITGGATVIVVYGGQVNIGAFKMKTAAGSSVTIVFAGPTVQGVSHIPTGSGMFDIQAPKTGVWKGIAIYQDPTLTTGVDLTEAGNAPAWKITGLVYMPHASVTFSGVVNKASNGDSCFGMVVDNLRINGTGEILAHGECPRAGLVLPTITLPGRGKLVS